MKPFKNFTGVVAPLDRSHVDTDQIIPKQFLKAIVRSGIGKGLFFNWRLRPDGSENPEFVLNREPFRHATILAARANFGSGSSREHAVWALADFGFRALIAPSFADIFRNNCLKNGLLPIILGDAEVDRIFEQIQRKPGYRLTVDLINRRVSDESGWSATFAVDAFQQRCLLEGIDDIALTLVHEQEIAAHEARHPISYPD